LPQHPLRITGVSRTFRVPSPDPDPTQVPRKRLSGDDLVEHPTNRHATGISALNAKADNPACEHVHHHHNRVAAQKYRFAAKQIDAPQAVLHMPDEAQPGRSIGSCLGSIVCRKHPADDVFVDIDAKGVRNLLCDAGTANTGVAAFELDDRVDEFLRGSLRAGAPMTSRREKPPILAFLKRAAWNLNKVLGFRMTASLGIRLAGTNSDPRPRRKRSKEFRFGARRRARLLMSNWCFSTKDSATTARTPPGRTSLVMVANRWTARMSR
jgi:hypothetical protein